MCWLYACVCDCNCVDCVDANYANYGLSLCLNGTVRAEPETVISRAWVRSIPRPGRINCFRITGMHALRLISRTGKRV